MLKTKRIPKIFQVKSNFRVTYTITFMGVDEQKTYRQSAIDGMELVNRILFTYVGTQYCIKSIDKIEKI